VWAQIALNTTASFSMTILQASIGTTSAVIAALSASSSQFILNNSFLAAAGAQIMPVGNCQMNLTTTTTVFLVANCSFSAGSGTAGGLLQARRRR